MKSEMKILIGLHRTVNEVDRKTSGIAGEYGLSFSQFAALETLYSKGDMTVGELQNKILSSTGTIPLIIKNLIAKGYVERETDSADRRRCILHLTESGRKVIEKAFPENLNMLVSHMQSLTGGEKKQLIFLLKKLSGKVKGEINMRNLQETVINRRTNYALDKNIKILPSKVTALVEEMTKEVPSPFNIQSARVVVALGSHHDKVWEITKLALKKIVPADKFAGTEAKLNGFAAGYGTILFFEETDTVKAMQEKFPLYAENFPVWASQANGMLQFGIWSGLTDMGLGVNLQHYNPLIDSEVKKHFNVPDSWTLVAEMVFGNPVAEPKPIDKMAINERVKIFQ